MKSYCHPFQAWTAIKMIFVRICYKIKQRIYIYSWITQYVSRRNVGTL